ncbi:MAG TPA: hypothetical protein VMF10_10355 [Candidatus Aquilonibacter sp.]|nr:hypothetical protein [Candidatus Aquilonibacter sp.]
MPVAKKAHAPASTLQYKLGKLPVRHDPRTLQFGAYLKQGLAPPPPTKSWTAKIPNNGWGMMDNDTQGDCTCAAAGHMIMDWTANTGKEAIVPNPKILAFYNHFAHGNPDAGANMLDVLNYWRKQGLDAHKIIAFAALELKSNTQVMDAVNLFGACYIGVALPNFAVAPGKNPLTIPWVLPPKGPVGDAAPNPQNGHCIPAVAYDQRNIYIVTWGQLKSMSWQFYAAYAEEAFVVLSQDWFNKQLGGKAPNGFDLAALKQDLKEVTA